MNRLPSVNQTLDLLGRLQSLMQEFAGREAKVEQDLQTRTTLENRRFEVAVDEEKARLAAEVQEAEGGFRRQAEQVKAWHEGRRSRINAAQKNSKAGVARKIETLEGGRKYEIQKSTLDAAANRKKGHAANEANYAEYQLRLNETRAAFAALEKAAGKAFRGYPKFQQVLLEPGDLEEPDLSKDEYQLFDDLSTLYGKTSEAMDRFHGFLLPRLFRYLSVWLLFVVLLVLCAAAVFVADLLGAKSYSYKEAGGLFAVLSALLFGGYFFGKRRGETLAGAISCALEEARRLHNVCLEKAQARHKQEGERVERAFESTSRDLERRWGETGDEIERMQTTWPPRVDEKAGRAHGRNERQLEARLCSIERERAGVVGRLRSEAESRIAKLTAARDERLAKFAADHQAQSSKLQEEWTRRINPLWDELTAWNKSAEARFADWRRELWADWTPPQVFENDVRVGRLEVDLPEACQSVPASGRLALPGAPAFSLPIALVFPEQGSLLLETTKSGSETVAATLNNIILRLLSKAPPGRVSFTIFDPVRLGENFAGVMHLSDQAEHLINGRIWTQANQIEQRLGDLNEHIEKVIQMYLRNEYATIAEYNEQAGNIAEKYHFLVLADFPVNFSEIAVKRLLNIVASGAKCGVYTLIHWDHRQLAPPDLVPAELRRSSVCVVHNGKEFALAGSFSEGVQLALETGPEPDVASEFLQKVGRCSVDSNRIEVPFACVTPPEEEFWTGDTADELRVPIGRTGATKLQYLAIGKGTRQHALFAGKTGSGKSTLFHVIITSLASWFSPEQVEFYLVDFKKGVEFKCYATHRLPHARVVAIESDREFGLSVLQRVDAELRRRGDLYRHLGVQDLGGYRRAGGTATLPRTLLIIDEFQEFFVEDDTISQNAAVLLDRIVRQGRAFGIHVLLGSQTLGGAYTLARTTIGQMVIRVALQCNEADAYLIMDDTNSAPRLLSRPGEGIYNDSAGSVEGNSPFQTVWLPEEEREAWLVRIRALADQKRPAMPAPIIFEGNIPADVRENAPLRELLEAESLKPASPGRIWLGSPVSIKGPTEAAFLKQSGKNLLVVGQRDEAALAILSVALVSLAAQIPVGAARFVVLDSTPPGVPQRDFLESVCRGIPHGVTLAKPADVPELLESLGEEMKRRSEDKHGAEAPSTFLFIHELQNYKKLRREDDFSLDADSGANPPARFNDLICEGSSTGVHVIVTCDTCNNVNRFLSRKALTEFEMRVLFQMSANDSASMCDSPRASTLGLYRALFYNEHEGVLELFRPYALPGSDWVEGATASLARLHAPRS